jgi:hypothetical protein
MLRQPRISQTVVGDYRGVWSVKHRARDSRKSFLENATIRWITARKLSSVAMAVLPISAVYDSWKFYNMTNKRPSDSEIPRLHLKFNPRFWSTCCLQGNLNKWHWAFGKRCNVLVIKALGIAFGRINRKLSEEQLLRRDERLIRMHIMPFDLGWFYMLLTLCEMRNWKATITLFVDKPKATKSLDIKIRSRNPLVNSSHNG